MARSVEEEKGNREVGGWASRAMPKPARASATRKVGPAAPGIRMARGATPSTLPRLDEETPLLPRIVAEGICAAAAA